MKANMTGLRSISLHKPMATLSKMFERLSETRVLEQKIESAVREQAQLVFRFVMRIVRNHHDAEDATQEVFLRVWRNAGRLEEIDDVPAWIARIAWNVAIDRNKRVGNSRWTIILNLPCRPVLTSSIVSGGCKSKRG